MSFYRVYEMEDGSEVLVEFTISKYFPPKLPNFMSPGEPAEGGEIEIIEYWDIKDHTKPVHIPLKIENDILNWLDTFQPDQFEE
jgi:hypothetical protein